MISRSTGAICKPPGPVGAHRPARLTAETRRRNLNQKIAKLDSSAKTVVIRRAPAVRQHRPLHLHSIREPVLRPRRPVRQENKMALKPPNKPVSEIRVLLSQCFRPWGVEDEYNTYMLSYEGANFSTLDGIWAPRGVCNEIATHFIANNIPVHTVVLDNPTLDEFRDECRKGYDIIGVSSMTMTIKKARKMIETAKEACPSAVTMVGGYVAVTPGVENIGADYVCREEGANFIRRFLGLPPVERYRNPPRVAVMQRATIMNDAIPSPLHQWYHLSLGLGCHRGCHFCASSHYYYKRYLPLLKTGEEVYQAVIESSEGLPSRRFAIFEDNFTFHKKRNRELWELAREELERPFFFFSFNELKSTSEYEPEMLAEMGCEVIFLAVETRAPDSTFFNKSKLGGLDRDEIRCLFARLHEAGIQTVAATIVAGTDDHTYGQYWDDLDFNISLEPTYSQMAPAIAMPGTGYWNQCLEEGRIRVDFQSPDFDLRDWTMVGSDFWMAQRPKHTGRLETALQVLNAFVTESYELGPDLFRVFAIKHHAAKKYRNSKSKLLRRKAELYAEECYRALPFLHLGARRGYGVKNPKVRQWIDQLRKDVIRFSGEPTPEMKEWTGELVLIAKREIKRKRLAVPDVRVEAVSTRREYNAPAADTPS